MAAKLGIFLLGVAAFAAIFALATYSHVGPPVVAAHSARTIVTPETAGGSPAIAVLPIEGLTVKDLYDSFNQARGHGRHEAIDIMKPRGTPVHAVVNGVVAKLFFSKAGGNTIYLFDNTQTFCYYFAHLDRYAEDLQEGAWVPAGQVIGYVGSTGDAKPSAPHLHFTIFQLGPEKRWWKGTAVNPYPILLQKVS